MPAAESFLRADDGNVKADVLADLGILGRMHSFRPRESVTSAAGMSRALFQPSLATVPNEEIVWDEDSTRRGATLFAVEVESEE